MGLVTSDEWSRALKDLLARGFNLITATLLLREAGQDGLTSFDGVNVEFKDGVYTIGTERA